MAINATEPGRVLVASDSRVARDPRVLKQIEWLEDRGWVVDTLGRGQAPDELSGRHHSMPTRPLIVRILISVLLPNRLRNRLLVGSTIPSSIRRGRVPDRYRLAIVNEIELLPWFLSVKHELMEDAPLGHVHLDLHEYSLSQSRALVYLLFFRRHRRWLAGFIPSPAFDSRTVVAEGIARLYADSFGIEPPSVVRNCPDFVELEPTNVDPHDIRLVHHGGASAARRIDLLIEAASRLSPRFSLHLMLVGSPRYIRHLRRLADRLGVEVTFHPAVGNEDVAAALAGFDLEVIFYPPATENLRYSLPNKFFEAIQGRIGLVVGDSPEMAGLARRLGNGAVAEGWTAAALAARIEALTTEEVEAMKAASHDAAPYSSSQSESQAFYRAVGIA